MQQSIPLLKRESNGYHSLQRIEQIALIVGVGSWKPKHKRFAVKLVDRCLLGSFEHRWYKDYASIASEEFRKGLSDNRKLIGYLKDNVFEQLDAPSSQNGKATLAYKLQPHLCKAIQDMELNATQNVKQQTKIVYSDATPVRRITPTRKCDPKSLGNVPAWCPVNIPALKKTLKAINAHIEGNLPTALRKELSIIRNEIERHNDNDANDVYSNHLSRVHSELNNLISLASNLKHYGHLPQTFEQAPSGRFYAKGFNLQNCTRLTRTAALHGYYNFDIESCHHSILLHKAIEKGWDCEHLKYYVDNKKALRLDIAEHTGESLESVKEALIIIMYGGNLSPYGSVAQSFTAEGYRRVLGHPQFCNLFDELQNLFSRLLAYSDGVKTGQVINDLGRATPFYPSDKSTIVAHILQGGESKALQAALSVHTSAVLPLHDGWVTTELESVTDAEKAIKKATGYNLKLGKPEQYRLTGISSN